ncbi:hypothetical protein T01_5618 [Trichinella spiralis]|uniref:Uncharacterized protein n=1 Tax=Trichinella spiralis TaxID=6334 RepID=A0A0V1BLQ8_TRISP|nr:hypothetical protein T01_5618 [Trichinella spiralis]
MNVTGMNKIRQTSETQATLYPIISCDLEQTVHGICFPFSFLCICLSMEQVSVVNLKYMYC